MRSDSGPLCRIDGPGSWGLGGRVRERRLVSVLERARALGFLGPGPVEAHLDHAEAFAAAVPAPPAHAIDLGSGGGVPGLVLAMRWRDSHWVLLDAAERRTAYLDEAVAALGIGERVRVVRARAEEAGHDPTLRGTCDLVTARSFGPPAVTAECGAPLLSVGGHLLVSEPPQPAATRWPAEELAALGLRLGPVVRRSEATVQVLQAVAPCPDRYPRRVGVPARRPLF